MEDSRKKVRRTFAFPVRTTFVMLAVAAAFAVAVLLIPGTASNSVVAAKEGARQVPSAEQVTPEMLSFALNLRSASHYTVFADKGISDSGSSQIRGNTNDALSEEEGILTRKELSNSIDAMMQLPCTEVAETDLTDKTFKPGVYCLPSADLAGRMVLDAENNPSGIFVFRVAGTLNAKNGSEIVLENGALSSNTFIVAGDRVTIGEGSIFRSNVLSRSDITVGEGSTIGSKVLALGKVELNENQIGNGTGTIEICKAINPSTTDISNRIFNFTVTGATGIGTAANPVRVPVGSCSGPIEVTAGPQTITELNTGQTLTGGTFTGGFILTNVQVLSNNSTSSLGTVNLATRTAAITVAEGDIATQLTLRFTNQFAITGYVEICKQGTDIDVTGFFTFNIEGVYTTNTQNPNVRTLQNFVAPVGQCTGAIAVTIANPLPTGNPLESTVRVSELGRPGFFLESVNTVPINREVGQEVLGSRVDANGNVVANPGGGYVTVRVISGGPSTETLINFVNRTNPGMLKVCKIAGPGVPLNTLFRFTVRGTGATNAAPPQTAVYGPVERTVDVRAGSPESGGTCQIVPGFGAGAGFAEFQTFVIGTPIEVYENGISPLNTISQPAGELRVSRIRSSSGFIPGYFSPFDNPDLEPGVTGEPPLAYRGRAAVPARASMVEVEFTNFYFRPTILKVCKIAGTGVAEGTPFTFDVALVSPLGPGNIPLFPPFTTAVTVNAGPASQGGFCTVVDGSGLLGGAFNIGSTITITERAVAGTAVTAITSPSSTVGVDLANRRATLSGSNGVVAGVTQVAFTNSAATITAPTTLYDFDGDGRADVSVFRPSTGTWWYSASGANGEYRAQGFGVSTDRPVAADYDGDGRTDHAVYRSGQWHVLGSTSGYRVDQFGMEGDIPQTGDFDGDRQADRVVYRPSTGAWYILRTTDGGFSAFPFGLPTDKPVSADYDGDGRMDPAVYRDGTWYILQSRDGFKAIQFGIASDRPVVADYDGDGRADFAVVRDGTWYILKSGTNQVDVKNVSAIGDIPVEADYDGDGKTDVAFFRPSNGTWYIYRSSQAESSATVSFGYGTDLPIPAY